MSDDVLLRVRDLQVEFPLPHGVLRAVDGAFIQCSAKMNRTDATR